MTRGQRRIIVYGLPILAWVLHVLLCEWVWREPIIEWPRKVAFWSVMHDAPNRGDMPTVTGLYPAPASSSLAASAAGGIVLPLVLVALDWWLILGWRRRDLIAARICVHCRHDLRGANHEKCPECGEEVEK